MGQQQLLLLVLSTVIVGLATVAGIQAFSENQSQAAQDALVQRGTSVMSDLKGALAKPSQLGGVSYGDSESTVLDKLGYEDGTSGNTYVPVEGAPGTSECQFKMVGSSTNTAAVLCTSPEADQDVKVTLNGSGNGEISTDFGTSLSLPS